MIIYSDKFTNLFSANSLDFDFAAVTLYPFIFLKKKFKKYKNKNNPNYRIHKILINHEKIHLEQQKELLVIFFMLLYFLCYVKGYYFKYRKIKDKRERYEIAYRDIIFEREAYANQNDFSYLKKRKIFGFIKF